jgi:hypothetical protein
MPVIAHDAVTAKTHVIAGKTFCNDFFKGHEIARLAKNTQPAVGTIDNMVKITTLSYSL